MDFCKFQNNVSTLGAYLLHFKTLNYFSSHLCTYSLNRNYIYIKKVNSKFIGE